jgi:ABC-type branched-subunit amino acid transport system ATPase component
MEASLLDVEHLTAGYAGAAVLRNVDMHVSAGEVVALLGANGAGKTTTLRAISGLVRPMAGRITFDGADVASVRPYSLVHRGLAHVPEGRGIFFGLTVAEHFHLGYGGERIDPDRAYAYFPALKELHGRRAGLLSGGEQQMLALARVLVRRQKLLLLDELSLGLAPIVLDDLFPVIRRFATDSGAGVLIVEQHVERVLEIADRGYVLSHGELALQGTGEFLRAEPALLTASYLGTEGLAVGVGDQASVDTAGTGRSR